MQPLCYALKQQAIQLWDEGRRVENHAPERAEQLKSLAISAAKTADEVANNPEISSFFSKPTTRLKQIDEGIK